MNIVKMSIDSIYPSEYNPRVELTPDDDEWKYIENSIKNFGYIDPIIINGKNNHIISGHQRFNILKHMGYDSIDCVIVDMDDQQEKACNIVLNKVMGDWDFDRLSDLLHDIKEFDMSLFGVLGDVDNINIDDFFEEDKPKEPKIKKMQCPFCGEWFEV